MAIGESTEAGDQMYRDVLGDRRRTQLDLDALKIAVSEFRPTDVLLMLDGPELTAALQADFGGAAIHIDTHGLVKLPPALQVASLLTSTTGADFHDVGADPDALRRRFPVNSVRQIVLKENRGGSRTLTHEGLSVDAPTFPVETVYSVGVGDVFDTVWVLQPTGSDPRSRLMLASWIASLYASGLDGESLAAEVEAAASRESLISRMTGIRLPWEGRPSISIYLAAPDFPGVDVEPLDTLASALRYHNFSPMLPIRDVGLARGGETPAEESRIYQGDRSLLSDARMLIALPLINDPGTYTELGLFAASGRPVILYNPRNVPMNLFVRKTATAVCATLGETIDAVFRFAA